MEKSVGEKGNEGKKEERMNRTGRYTMKGEVMGGTEWSREVKTR